MGASEISELDERILAYMRRAPAGAYTAAQLARTTSQRIEEIEARLGHLEHAGVIQRSLRTASLAFHVVEHRDPHSRTNERQASTGQPRLTRGSSSVPPAEWRTFGS
jgi:hypothetical protein